MYPMTRCVSSRGRTDPCRLAGMVSRIVWTCIGACIFPVVFSSSFLGDVPSLYYKKHSTFSAGDCGFGIQRKLARSSPLYSVLHFSAMFLHGTQEAQYLLRW
ncbi:Isoleucine--tRNA ligase [Trichinella spiralis]|uniref:Isoleucine--tRNA ligase n=1 Tax=Trichinella spiralis TaxID=6334 RepID=A0ABR3KV35_TRISP